MIGHENIFTHIAERYKYIDKSSWEVADRIDLNPEELLSILHTALQKNQLIHSDITIFAFRYIWNRKNIQLGKQILKMLLTSSADIFHSFYYFLESKAYHFNGEYDLSVSLLDKAEKRLQPCINGNHDYRKLLTCIGSLSDADPEGIEYSVMKAIIANDKGNNYHALGQYDEAIGEFICALQLQSESYSTMCHANIAYTRRCMAKTLEAKGMHDKALEQYKLSNSIANNIYSDESHPEATEIKAALYRSACNSI